MSEADFREQIEDHLDRGQGETWLSDPKVAEAVQNALPYFDGERYDLHGWVIMPNHVHVLATPREEYRLSDILHSWKSYSAKEANRILGRTGAFWQEEYFDRYIRDERHFTTAMEYIENNPVKAGLCSKPEEWRHSHLGTLGARPSWSQNEEPAHVAGETPAPPDDEAQAYAAAVATYLAFAVDRCSDAWSSLASWSQQRDTFRNTFARQALPMVWDFAEANAFSNSGGNFNANVSWIATCIDASPTVSKGFSIQQDATASVNSVDRPIISTDPPYYDNIGYADLSDFFYVWLRRSLGEVHPDVFGTMLVPKTTELVATPYRFGGSKQKAREFFEAGLGEAFRRMRENANPDYPLTIYYAFKQAESEAVPEGEGSGVMAVASTGWETMLEGLMRSGFQITGTWPMRTERAARSTGLGTNALASSVVMVCRARAEDAPIASRRDFQNALRRELPGALSAMIRENIAPVDLAQSAIGPGMAIYSRHSRVLENDGSPLRVRTALALINQQLDAVLAEQEGELDDDSRFCVAWYEQFGEKEAEYGLAETLSKAKNTSVRGLQQAGVLASRAGKVRLLRRDELPEDWDPATDKHTNAWEATQHLVRAVQEGEQKAAALVRKLGPERSEEARQLAYRLHQISDRKKWSEKAFAYNSLSQSWERVLELARREEEGALF